MGSNDTKSGESQVARTIRPYRVTSFDVAAEAGVSQSTVSRALAGDPVVSEATRLRVAEAARRLNYHVDENAARLRTGKTGTLAVVLICRPGENRKDVNPFYFSLLGSICAAASNRGHETLVSFQDTTENLSGMYQEQRKADGVIVIGTTENREAWAYFQEIAGSGANIVCWGAPWDDLPWVRSDNAEGTRLAVRHLIDKGYRQIACIASETSPQRQFKERYEAYVTCMEDAGLQPHLVPIEKGLPRDEQGRRAMAALAQSGQAFDAVFAVCDEIALGVLEEMHARAIRVPQDVGLIGFDGLRAGAHVTPSLSSVEPDFQAAGSILVEKLLAMIGGKPDETRRAPVRLIERGSTQR
ncbi:MAG: LacI family DNA-binding transcriptional regulator [Sphingomonadales bacterium]|nr:LacI family DNA-binding transcriptional regulator [Sphingomonadales bacterium]